MFESTDTALARLKAAGCRCHERPFGELAGDVVRTDGTRLRLGASISDEGYSALYAKTQRRRVTCHGCWIVVVFDEPTPLSWWSRGDRAREQRTRTALNHRRRRQARRARRAAKGAG
jgi:hypothetical protein